MVRFCFSFLILSLCLGACSQGGSGGNGNNPDAIDYGIRDDSCDFSYSEGPLNSASPSACAEENADCHITTASFGKKFNQEHLRQVYKISAQGTAKYISTIGADVYRAPLLNGRRCSVFAQVQSPPSDVADTWEEESRDVKREDSSAQLAGLFLEEFNNSRSVILVAANSSRYTLIHEMMHHLFALERKKQTGKSYAQFRQELKTVVTRFQESVTRCPSTNPTKECTAQLAKDFETALKYSDEAIVISTLEEPATELTLLKALKSGVMEYIPDFSRNAYWYLSTNTRKARYRYEQQLQSIDLFFKDYDVTAIEADRQTLQQRRSKVNERLSEISSVEFEGLQLRNSPIPQTALLLPKNYSSIEEEPLHPCTHGDELEEIMVNLSF